MDLLVTACLLVASAAVLVIGVLLTGIASDIRRTREALEKMGEAPPSVHELETVAAYGAWAADRLAAHRLSYAPGPETSMAGPAPPSKSSDDQPLEHLVDQRASKGPLETPRFGQRPL